MVSSSVFLVEMSDSRIFSVATPAKIVKIIINRVHILNVFVNFESLPCLEESHLAGEKRIVFCELVFSK